jgi:hypothetical protein
MIPKEKEDMNPKERGQQLKKQVIHTCENIWHIFQGNNAHKSRQSIQHLLLVQYTNFEEIVQHLL